MRDRQSLSQLMMTVVRGRDVPEVLSILFEKVDLGLESQEPTDR